MLDQVGVIVIPAARVRGGGDEAPDDADIGGGFAVSARLAGALVVGSDGSVVWKVPFDLNRIILGGQTVGIAYFRIS
jgi:hypothetical protein